MVKIANQKDCECLQEWIKPVQNHLYWSATSTFDGEGKVILAKFESFLSHVIDKHSNLDNRLFNKCAHDDSITDKKWLDEGISIEMNGFGF